MSAGRSLKTGLGEFSRRTISPCIVTSVSPTRSRIPREMLNSPRNARTGIVRPTTARAVRDGRVIRFCQAKLHMAVTPRGGRNGVGEDDPRSVVQPARQRPGPADRNDPDSPGYSPPINSPFSATEALHQEHEEHEPQARTANSQKTSK